MVAALNFFGAFGKKIVRGGTLGSTPFVSPLNTSLQGVRDIDYPIISRSTGSQGLCWQERGKEKERDECAKNLIAAANVDKWWLLYRGLFIGWLVAHLRRIMCN